MEFDYQRIEGTKADHDIRLFTLSTCGHCKNVKKLMKELGMTYGFIDVDLSSRQVKREITQFLRENNLPISFPVIMIDDEIIIGYHEKKIIKLLK